MPTSHCRVCAPAGKRPVKQRAAAAGRRRLAATVTVTCAAAVSVKLTVVVSPEPSDAGVIVAGETERPVTSVVVGVTGAASAPVPGVGGRYAVAGFGDGSTCDRAAERALRRVDRRPAVHAPAERALAGLRGVPRPVDERAAGPPPCATTLAARRW